MSDPRDIDEDALLRGLSAEELDQLEYELQEMDPEVRPSDWFWFTLSRIIRASCLDLVLEGTCCRSKNTQRQIQSLNSVKYLTLYLLLMTLIYNI